MGNERSPGEIPDSLIPEDFAELERSFISRSEEAIAQGIELERWMRDPNRVVSEFPLPAGPNDALSGRMFGYFADVTVGGKTLSALGAGEEVEFGRICGPHAGERLKDYVLGSFLSDATWVYADGDPGGFQIEQMIYRQANGHHGRYDADNKSRIRDWRQLGPTYQWSLFTILLHDFVFRIGKFRAPFMPRGAVAVVQSPEFVHVVENPKPGFTLEVAIGFPFIDHAPIPNFFGFGPGKFAWAVQTFSFLLREDNTVRCDLDFVAGPRPKRVIALGNMPCPIYGPADLLKALTFGLFPAHRIRDRIDSKMALRHCRVHHALMEGTAKIFATGTSSSQTRS